MSCENKPVDHILQNEHSSIGVFQVEVNFGSF